MILQRCKREHLQMLYNIPYFDGTLGFLLEVARVKGRIRKGGVPDLEGTARTILRDWCAGRIAYYTSPPTTASPNGTTTKAIDTTVSMGTVSAEDVDSSTLLTEFAPAFDLKALFGEADEIAFGEEGVAGSGMMGKSVKMVGFEGDSENANVGWITGEGDDDEMEQDEEMDADMNDDDVDVEDLLDDDEEEEDDDDNAMEMDLPVAKPLLKTKRPAPSTNIISVAPTSNKKSKKSVSFSSTPLGPTSSTSANPASSNVKSILTEQTSEISLNKSIKKSAKDKKKKAKKEAGKATVLESNNDDVEMEGSGKPRGKVTVSGRPGVEEAYSFEEFFGKGSKAGKIMPNDEDSDEEL